jgi:hypothetical protein
VDALTIEGMARPTDSQPLDLRVLRKGKKEDEFQATGIPADHKWLQGMLRGWLEGNKWHPGRWPEFELEARPAGEWSGPLAKVRT